MNWLRRLFAPAPVDELAPMRAGFAAMIRRAEEMGAADGGLAWQIFGCSIRGERLGDWEFAVRRIAQVGDARRAETQRGSVHEHAVAEGDAPETSIAQTSEVNND